MAYNKDLFYKSGEPSGLPHDPFKSLVVPRPIGWISTQNKEGVDNLAPFSQFTNVSFDPPTVLSFLTNLTAKRDIMTRFVIVTKLESLCGI